VGFRGVALWQNDVSQELLVPLVIEIREIERVRTEPTLRAGSIGDAGIPRADGHRLVIQRTELIVRFFFAPDIVHHHVLAQLIDLRLA
jgi:hypothetical protein